MLLFVFSCPEKGVMSRWTYTANNQIAEATIYSMFRFADSKRLNFQCDVLLCKGIHMLSLYTAFYIDSCKPVYESNIQGSESWNIIED